VVSAPSGAGKTTVCRTVTGRDARLHYSVSATTRPRRKGEKNKKDYLFLSEAEFERGIKTGRFLEYAKVFGYYYGTPKGNFVRALASGSDVIMDLDLEGCRSLQKLYPDCVTIFLAPPSWDELKQRLRKRGTDSAAEINKRLARVEVEMKSMAEFQYVVINQKLEVAVRNILAIIHAERLKTGRYL